MSLDIKLLKFTVIFHVYWRKTRQSFFVQNLSPESGYEMILVVYDSQFHGTVFEVAVKNSTSNDYHESRID